MKRLHGHFKQDFLIKQIKEMLFDKLKFWMVLIFLLGFYDIAGSSSPQKSPIPVVIRNKFIDQRLKDKILKNQLFLPSNGTKEIQSSGSPSENVMINYVSYDWVGADIVIGALSSESILYEFVDAPAFATMEGISVYYRVEIPDLRDIETKMFSENSLMVSEGHFTPLRNSEYQLIENLMYSKRITNCILSFVFVN